jgi:histidine ammonia-lyase
MPEGLALGAADLTIEDVVSVARARFPVAPLPAEPSPDDPRAPLVQRVRESAAWIREAVERAGESPAAIYGINTGFGANAGKAIFTDSRDAWQLSRNLVVSHSAGTGDWLDEEIVRATMLIRAHGLAQGYSGVRLAVINTLVAMLNAGITPAIPEQGSLGASGDLAPLAHLALALSAPPEGEAELEAPPLAFYGGALVSCAEAMSAAGIPQMVLGPKEALAFINGPTFSAAIAALALFDAERLLRATQSALAMSLEAMRGYRDAYLPLVHALRRLKGQQAVAASVYDLLSGSTLVRGDADRDLQPEDSPPQDPYCLRCAPQVLGAVMDTLQHVRGVLTCEINAVTDNPLIFVDDLPRAVKAVSGGNFHGEPVAFAADFLSIAVSELASIAERRTFTLLASWLNRGLPAFLIEEPPGKEGLQSGLMIAQYTAAALVSENKTLAHPDSVDSIPTSADQEDHVSMSMNAARHARRIVRNAEGVVAIELLCAAQALDLRMKQRPDAALGVGTRAGYEAVRAEAPFITHDTPLWPLIERLRVAVRAGKF